MMWFIEKLISLLSFPIIWFWESFQKYNETKSIGKIILLFACSLCGLAILVTSLAWLVVYLVNYRFGWLMMGGVIIWLYAYVKTKVFIQKPDSTGTNIPAVEPVVSKRLEQAEKGYPIMRNIIYQTLKNIAQDIGGIVPRLSQEIEIQFSQHFILAHNIAFYQFKLDKADIQSQYHTADLEEFKAQIQVACSRLISSGNFPTLQMQSYLDTYGNWHDAVCIAVVEDVGNAFIIQSVFASPEYAEYLHQLQLNQQYGADNTTIPDADWRN